MSEPTGYKERPEYRELPRSRQMLVDALIATMRTAPEWHRGWKAADVPMSMTGREYRGENNVSLTLAAMVRGYQDPRWMTFNQMRSSGWSFKTDENGKSLGKEAGVAVSFFVLRDKKTKKEFDKSSIRGLSEDEREKYMRDNVYPLRRTYVVFNASIIEGVPALAKPKRDAGAKSEDAERFLDFWDKNMTPISYGGDRSCFVTKKNLIRLPRPEAFESAPEFYATAFHELAHSCQGFTRPGVELDTDMGSPQYKKDELSAEISSVFLSQKLCGALDANALKNSAAYLDSWLLGESDELKTFFDAVTEAEKLSKYALDTYGKKTEEREEERAREARKIFQSGIQASLFEAKPEAAPGEEGKLRTEPKIENVNVRRPTDLGFDPEYPTSFRVGPDGFIPPEAYEARMALLLPSDREAAEEAFEKDPELKEMFFGKDAEGNPGRNAARTMMGLSSHIPDVDECVRIFSGSAWKETVSDALAADMAKDAALVLAGMREKKRVSPPAVKRDYSQGMER